MSIASPPDAMAYTRLMQQAWEQWAASLSGHSPSLNAAGEEQIERLLSGLKGYFGLLESLQSQVGSDAAGEQWRSLLGGIFGGGQPFTQAFGEASALAGGGPQAWMEAWSRMQSPLQSGISTMLGMPAFGPAREHQEHAQRLARDVLDYQEQLRRYNQLLARAGRRGAERFEAMLAERTEPGRAVESLRALYDLWVDAAEEGFQEVALSPEWREVYGALVNAQMRVRQGVQQQAERTAREFGLPTRSEVATLGQRLHDLRRQVRNLEERLAGAETARAEPDDPARASGPAARAAGGTRRAAGSRRKSGAPRRP